MTPLASVFLSMATSSAVASATPAAAGAPGGAIPVTKLLELYRSIRPGEADPELDSLLSKTLAGQAGFDETIKFLSARFKQDDGSNAHSAQNHEVLIHCEFCDRYSFMKTGRKVGKLG